MPIKTAIFSSFLPCIHAHTLHGEGKKRSNEQILDIPCRSILIRTHEKKIRTLKWVRQQRGRWWCCSVVAISDALSEVAWFAHVVLHYPWITFSHSTRWLIINFSYSLLFSMAWFIRIWITFDVITHSHSCIDAALDFSLFWIDLLFRNFPLMDDFHEWA